ncbi:hypothetical protein [Metabacillus indicus]|uniref:hypothetical protein n=1 Tax=Metabacillus indicus TaxID=246786 RepID=UPI0004938E6A|nr:hypothetical protein [Metabacillus indicus]KEZ47747.1 hypothetical protein AZ46_0220360 [Metabacillus indicus LMG 22858]
MKLTNKYSLIGLSIGIGAALSVSQLLPKYVEGEERIRPVKVEKVKEQKSEAQVIEIQVFSEKEIEEREERKERRLKHLQPGIYKVGENEIVPGKWQLVAVDQKRDGQIQIFDEGEEHIQSNARWSKLFGSFEKEPEYDWENIHLFEDEVIVVDTEIGMLLLE